MMDVNKPNRYIVSLKDTETDDIREIIWYFHSSDDMTDEEQEKSMGFIWTDGGNYSCDCNRAICFYGRNEEGTPYEDYPCGETRFELFSIEKIISTKKLIRI